MTSAQLSQSESQVSRKVVKDDFWSKKNKAENPFGGAGRKFEETTTSLTCKKNQVPKCPSEIVEVDGCSNSPVCNDEILLKFRNFDAADGDTSQITLKSIGGHVVQITADTSMGAIDTNFYAPTAWCTSISEEWIVNHLDITIVSASEENGGIRFMKEG